MHNRLHLVRREARNGSERTHMVDLVHLSAHSQLDRVRREAWHGSELIADVRKRGPVFGRVLPTRQHDAVQLLWATWVGIRSNQQSTCWLDCQCAPPTVIAHGRQNYKTITLLNY
jgi:hypothetical protein